MAYIDLYPTSDDAEKRMMVDIEAIREIVRKYVTKVWEVPEHDIIVMTHRNTVLSQDPVAQEANAIPDLIIKIQTSDAKLQECAERLRDLIVEAWKIYFGTAYPMELWIGFFHTWGCTIDFS